MLRASALLRIVNTGKPSQRVVVPPVAFGKRKAEQAKVEEAAKRERDEHEAHRRTVHINDPKAEEVAWRRASSDFGFMLKPPHHTWVTFRDELERFDLVWQPVQLEPSIRIRCTLTDHAPLRPDSGSTSAMVFDKCYDQVQCPGDSVVLLLEAVDGLQSSAAPTHNVPLFDPALNDKTTLELSPYQPHGFFDALAKAEAEGRPKVDPYPWRRVRGHLDDLQGARSGLLFDMSVPALTSVVLRSLVVLFSAEAMPGITVAQLTPRTDFTHTIIPLWHRLRAGAKMHRAEFPINLRRLGANNVIAP